MLPGPQAFGPGCKNELYRLKTSPSSLSFNQAKVGRSLSRLRESLADSIG